MRLGRPGHRLPEGLTVLPVTFAGGPELCCLYDVLVCL